MAVVGLALATLLGTVAAARQATGTLALDPSGPVVLHSSAGPVEVGVGPVDRIDYQASWLLRGPTLHRTGGAGGVGGVGGTGGGGRVEGAAPVIEVRCDTDWPCRARTRIELQAATDLSVRSEAGPVLVEQLAGSLSIDTGGSHPVTLGPVEGEVRVETDQGDVVGHGLAATTVEIRTGGGAVTLSFRDRPALVQIVAGTEPVEVMLPPGRYAVSVGGNPSATVEVDQDDSADSRIRIDGRGPVRIGTTTTTTGVGSTQITPSP